MKEKILKKLQERFNYCIELANKNRDKGNKEMHSIWLARADEVNTTIYLIEEI